MRANVFMYFVLRITSGPRVKICRSKSALNPLRRWSCCYFYYVWIGGFYNGAFHIKSCLALCSLCCCFFSPIWFCYHLARGRELEYVILVYLFVYFARVNFCPLSLPLWSGISCGL